ncbi:MULTISPECIES: methyl-accepting chemotaxis protein [Pseudomonadati]|uniref:Methyl-accepting chemotaxis protein n=1 Tax=Shewanella aestuarii TaxID=1028752 RepID=A0ABT0L2T5_9GAMM|nr:methyl-accepting chemotaxis protein [Shewanella aestuarii]MCL1118022.1 methyl-accepting chemotaxis protein [Shewanella aestuarii]GGN79506.1 chemotaxis protein [Shewanella aestuarii]
MKLKQKLLLAFLSIGLIPACIISISVLFISSQTLTQQAFNQLDSIKYIKKEQIESYFAERQGDLNLLQYTLSKRLNFNNERDLSDSAELQHDYFEHFVSAYQYYDLFVISPTGNILYTVAKESDYQTNLNNGTYRDSNLGELFRHTMSQQSYQLTDFAPYAPSNHEPAAFIAQPIIEDNQVKAVIALQLSLESINEIMQLRAGMGDTGESYLVGPDLRMRSDSFLDPTGHSVKASFSGNVKNNGVDTAAAHAALKGISDTQIITDYNGNPVLSSYAQIKINDLYWALLVEIDEAEAMAAVHHLRWIILLISVVAVIGILMTTYVITQSILRPLGGEPKTMQVITERIASGDLTVNFESNVKLIGVYGAMRTMSTYLKQIIGSIVDATSQLSATAEQTSSTSHQSNISLQEQQANIHNVSVAMQEMATTIADVAMNARNVADSTSHVSDISEAATTSIQQTITVIASLSDEVSRATNVVQEIANQSQSIGSVLEVIRSIAEQTNLLALNAAIEAARAGEQGRGFAVVADEVRQLASKTQNSTADIELMIQTLQTKTNHAVTVMQHSAEHALDTVDKARHTQNSFKETTTEIERIALNAQQIAAAAVQQADAAEEINQCLVTINDVGRQNAEGAQQISEASADLSHLVRQLNGITLKFKLQ